MTIGIDASRANLEQKTGTEWYSYQIIRSLVRAHPEARFWLYTKEPLRPPLNELKGAHVENRVLRWPLKLLWSQLRLSAEMLLRPPDILFVPAHTIPYLHPRATVTTCHDVGFERFPELYGTRPIGPAGMRSVLNLLVRLLTLGRYGTSELDYHRFSMRYAVRHASMIITVSQFTADELQTIYRVPPQKIVVIPHGFSVPERKAIESQAHLAKRLRLIRPYLLTVGRIERKKNISGLVEAYHQLQVESADAPDLVLVGKDGYGAEEVTTGIARLPRPEQVHRFPWLPPTEVTSLMEHATAYVFPSYYEGFGLPLLEAFSHDLPVVSSKAGSLPEVAGDSALFFDPYQPADLAGALRRVLHDSALRERLVRRGRERLTRFRWEKAAEATYRVLRSAVAE